VKLQKHFMLHDVLWTGPDLPVHRPYLSLSKNTTVHKSTRVRTTLSTERTF